MIKLVLALVAAIAVFWGFQHVSPAQNRPALFSIKNAPELKTGSEMSSPASILESDIAVDLKRLEKENSESLAFPLFDGRTYLAVRNKSEGFERRGPYDFTWRGRIDREKFEGDVVLTVYKGFMTGMIYAPDAVYEIVAKGDRQILVQLDHRLFPECGGEVRPALEKDFAAPQNVGAVEDSGDRIDVLVVYTAAVKASLGGDAQAQALAQSAVDISNTAYRNSKIRQRLRLVHSVQTALTEANSLSQLRADPATQVLRDTHNADMVAMLVDSLSGCGVAYVMTSVSTGFAPSAYSITLRTCAVGNLTFAHELGHNMGSTHDPANGGSASYPYSYGHFVNGSYRTVMSYSTECTSGCARVAQFSNPAVIYNGVPTGIQDARDNSRSIENTADTVANFRYSGSSLRLDNLSRDAFIPRNISKTLNWSSNNLGGNVKVEYSVDEGTNWVALVASTPNDGSHVINLNTRPTKRARIRISSLNDPSIGDSSVKNLWIK